MCKNIGKNKSKILSVKYSPGMLPMPQKLCDYAKQSAADVFKTASKGAIRKTEEAAGDLIRNKTTNKNTKAPKIHKKIIQRPLQMSMTKKYLKKKKERKIDIPRKKTRRYWWFKIKVIIQQWNIKNSQKFQKNQAHLHEKIIQAHLQMRMLKKYLDKYIKKYVKLYIYI